MAKQTISGTPASGAWDGWFRERLATVILIVSLLSVGLLAGIAIYIDRKEAKEILTMVLPMVGTWVGTVLAFYFGKEQLEAATRSVTSIARELTPEEKLRSLPVKEQMIPISAAFVATGEPGSIRLLQAVADLDREKKGNRLPVLKAAGEARCVVHRSTIDRFIARAAAAGRPPADLEMLTLADMLANPELTSQLEGSFAVVAESATLADAKRAMDASPWCQDTFITRDGGRNSAVLGWVTNVIVETNSRV